jgi:hypothetical protein
MSTISRTPEENARAIIQGIVNRGVQPNEIDSYSSVEAAFLGSALEFKEGLQYAFQQGWVVVIDDHQLQLTHTGYDAARP